MLEAEIIKQGDDSGNGTLIKYTSPAGAVIKAIGVPQSWKTTLGPTWCYVIEGDDLTLIDPGCFGSVSYLEEGLEQLGHSLTSVDRVVVSHGHMDHDGSCLTVVRKSGAEIWAHEIYGSMLRADRWEMEMGWRREIQGFKAFETSDTVATVREHHDLNSRLTLDHPVTDEHESGGLTFYHTPGHSPDELCILFDQALFSGDHILPLITPHPSVAMSYNNFQSSLPAAYRDVNEIYGLKALLTSLKRVAAMEGDITVLPAHRAFYRSRLNPIGLERATEIVEFHRNRCHELTDIMKAGPMVLDSLTRKYFSDRKLEEQNFFMAFSEVMSHIELMQESGDVSIIADPAGGRVWSNGLGPGILVRWEGSDLFSDFIDQL